MTPSRKKKKGNTLIHILDLFLTSNLIRCRLKKNKKLSLQLSLTVCHSLVGLHVDCSAADDVEEKHRPLGGLLCAALHRVKHPAHLNQTENGQQTESPEWHARGKCTHQVEPQLQSLVHHLLGLAVVLVLILTPVRDDLLKVRQTQCSGTTDANHR